MRDKAEKVTQLRVRSFKFDYMEYFVPYPFSGIFLPNYITVVKGSYYNGTMYLSCGWLVRVGHLSLPGSVSLFPESLIFICRSKEAGWKRNGEKHNWEAGEEREIEAADRIWIPDSSPGFVLPVFLPLGFWRHSHCILYNNYSFLL